MELNADETGKQSPPSSVIAMRAPTPWYAWACFVAALALHGIAAVVYPARPKGPDSWIIPVPPPHMAAEYIVDFAVGAFGALLLFTVVFAVVWYPIKWLGRAPASRFLWYSWFFVIYGVLRFVWHGGP